MSLRHGCNILLLLSAFTDSTQKDLLKLIGNLPVRYEGESQLGAHGGEGRKPSRFSVLTAASLFQGHSYNFPVLLWLMDSFPFTPPICFLRPTSNMVIREGKHVDARGRLFLPGLHNWDYVGLIEKVIHKVISPSNRHNFYFVALFKPKSSVVALLNEMTAKFEEEPPLSSKATVENKDPHELLAFVSNLQINDGTSSDAQTARTGTC